MNKYLKRRLKRNIYKHGNLIIYVGIFAIASIVTLVAVASRSDRDVFINKSQVAVTELESIAMKDKDTQKVAAKGQIVDETIKDSEPESGSRVTIKVDTLNVRSEASQEAEPLGIVDKGETFQIISQNEQWIEIEYNGNNGFVKAEFVEIN